MCGIAGYWHRESTETPSLMRDTITRMTRSLARRGPDGAGVWIHPKEGIALGHRRLSIRDLSPAGHQPMSTSCGRYTISYNGEIYNSDEIAGELNRFHGVSFKSHTDTEVLLYACAVWGIRGALEKLIGMFAFALWDEAEGKLFLCRDRLGVKPLYWGWSGPVLLFASELKALAAHPLWQADVNRDAVAELLRCCYIPAPLSIYKGIQKLRPGHLLEISRQGSVCDEVFWSARETMLRCSSERFEDSDEALASRLEALLKDAVRRRMVADVPLGTFLSGGIDSSLVAALMQSQSSRPVKTFSIGFEHDEYNEAPYARAVARHLGTDHTEQMMSSRQAWDIIPHMPQVYDEPFADSSQLPTYLLSRLTRGSVTVALSGDGGDELFSGYGRYFNFIERFPNGDCPVWKKRLAFSLARVLSPGQWDGLSRVVPERFRPANFGARLHAFAKRSSMPPGALYRLIGLGHWPDPLAMVPGSAYVPSIFDDERLSSELPIPIERMQFLDSVHYLPDDILVKVDRASMAQGLEVRVPLLDHRVYEFAWHLPYKAKVRGGKGKWILREILRRYVPENLFERPKMGFGVPIDHWLRGPLRDWAEDLLEPSRMRQEGFLEPDTIQEIWKKHLAGPESYHYWLWDVLMFQSWFRSARRPSEASDGFRDTASLECVNASAKEA